MIDIRVSSLEKTYRTGGKAVRALDGVTFQVDAGAFVAVIGYSGCGKTTLFRHIAGLEAPDSGGVSFSGDFADSADSAGLPRLGMMFQEPRLLPWLTVRDNLLLALKRVCLPDRKALVDEALSQVGLASFDQAYPDQLSGGMAQRTALARTLCRKPALLLMDEPFGALDALTRLLLQDELARIWSERPMTVLFITHDIAEALTLADRILIMAQGRIVKDREVSLSRPRRSGSPELEHLKQEFLETILNKNQTEEST